MFDFVDESLELDADSHALILSVCFSILHTNH